MHGVIFSASFARWGAPAPGVTAQWTPLAGPPPRRSPAPPLARPAARPPRRSPGPGLFVNKTY
jgi:hypothetical protein